MLLRELLGIHIEEDESLSARIERAYDDQTITDADADFGIFECRSRPVELGDDSVYQDSAQIRIMEDALDNPDNYEFLTPWTGSDGRSYIDERILVKKNSYKCVSEDFDFEFQDSFIEDIMNADFSSAPDDAEEDAEEGSDYEDGVHQMTQITAVTGITPAEFKKVFGGSESIYGAVIQSKGKWYAFTWGT